VHITLIGMSNIGKSHWAKKLAAEGGFERIDCDGLVEQKLKAELSKAGHSGIEGMAKWLGQPFDPQYPETSQIYTDRERAVMEDVIAKLGDKARPLVIDTTGSVIYTGDDILERLRNLTKVVYFEASRDHVAHLFAKYATDPKPLIWNGAYAPRAGEAAEDALKRCYPELLEGRARRYAKIAHVTIPFDDHKKAADIAVLLRPSA